MDTVAVDLAEYDIAELARLAWETGAICDWKLDQHQIDVDNEFSEWNARRLTPEYVAKVVSSGATLDDVWVEEIGRRFGKTAKWICRLTDIALARPHAVLLYGTAYQKDIAEIIIPLAEMLYADAPEELRPKYKRSKGGQNEGIYFANGSVIRLAGLDEHPNAFRGRFLDGAVLSEAGFMKGLEDLARSVLLPQFQRRPWAFLALESSTSKQLDHDFLTVFVPDAKLRGAYVRRTIDDNHAINAAEKAKAIRQAGGRGHVTCEREYYCEQVRDPEGHVIPEFNEAVHVRGVERPPYYYAIVGADPGMTDLFGQVWGYYDFDKARLVIEHSWCARNASTRTIAAVNAAVELMLYGRQPPAKMADIPLRTEGDKVGWTELLRPTPYERLARRCWQLAGIELGRAHEGVKRLPMKWEINHPSQHSVFWNGDTFNQNPYSRHSDIELRLMADLTLEYDIFFQPTAKDDKEAQINLVRNALGGGQMVFTPDAGPVIEHVKHAVWNEKRTDWVKHKVHGHYDCLSALIYLKRNAQALRSRRPHPPAHTDPRQMGVATWYQPPTKNHEVSAIVGAFGDMGRQWR